MQEIVSHAYEGELEYMNFKYFILFLLIGSMIGCVSSPEDSVTRRNNVYFNVQNLGEDIIRGSDTLRVNEFKFIMRQFDLLAEDSVVISTTEDFRSLLFAYTTANVGDRLVISVPFGFQGYDLFEGFHIYVNQLLDGDFLLDNDFYGDPENYSIVIKGTHNQRNFTLSLTNAFNRFFQFDEIIELSHTQETLVIRMLLDVEDVFIRATDNTVINPRESGNHNTIIEQFRDEIRVEAYAVRLF